MPEEMEVPTEHLHETMEEKAHHSADKWTLQVALSSALLAVLAALASLMAGHHVNEALIEQLRSSDQWAYYQSKGIKSVVLSSKIDMLQSMGKPVNPKDTEKVAEYWKQQGDIKIEADERQKASEAHLVRHNALAKGVTAFQIAIALSAIAVLTKKKPLWLAGLALSLGGVVYLILGLM